MIFKIVEVLATISDVVFLAWFTTQFTKSTFKSDKSPWKYIWLVTLFVFQLTADILFQGFDIVAALGALLISILFSISICDSKVHGFRNILSACLFMTVCMVSGSIVYEVFSFVLDDVNVIMQGNHENERIIYIVVSVIVRFILFKLILLVFRSNDKLDKSNGFFVLFCFALMAVGLGILMYISLGSPDISPSLILFLVLILTLSNSSLYFLIYKLQRYRKKEYEYRLMRERISFAQTSSDEATRIWENIRKVRHEMKNHLTVISGKLNVGDIDGCRSYLTELVGTVENFGDIVKTDNAVIDYLINSKLTGLDGVKVIVSGYVGSFSDIADADLACIIGNLIDNAIDAENKIKDKEKRIIELHFLLQNQTRIIVCKNAIESSVLTSNKNLHTTKDDVISHGLGHQIVAEIAEKYYGFVNYTEIDDMFCVQVVLPKIV